MNNNPYAPKKVLPNTKDSLERKENANPYDVSGASLKKRRKRTGPYDAGGFVQ